MSELPPPKFNVGAGEQVYHAIALWSDDNLDTLHLEVAADDELQAEERVREAIRRMVVAVGPPDRVELFTLEEWTTARRPLDDAIP
jgi:hypothetical protein